MTKKDDFREPPRPAASSEHTYGLPDHKQSTASFKEKQVRSEKVAKSGERNTEVAVLTATQKEKIANWLLRYPPEWKRSGVFEALRMVQEDNKGYLTVPLMNAVADFLEIPRIAVYEVANFYSMYNLEPVGKHVIEVCTNISCMLNGAEKIVEHCKKQLAIEVNGTTADGKFTLREVECLGACIAAPVCQIGKKYHEKLTPETIDAIMAELK